MEKTITLSELRKKNNMSQRALAKELKISHGTVGMYESGKRTPPLNRAIQIANMFNVSVEAIRFHSN